MTTLQKDDAKKVDTKSLSQDLTNMNGSVSKTTNGNGSDPIKQIVDRMKTQMINALPKQINSDRFMRVLMTTLRTNDSLMKCKPESLMASMMHCAQFGLEPGPLGQCYLIPYKQEVEFQLGYKGMIDLARRSGEIESIAARCVYENDEFTVEYGMEDRIVHRPMLNSDRGKIVLAYCISKFKSGGHHFEIVTHNEIDKAKKASKSSNSEYSPWKNWEDEMWMKTAVKKAFKFLPVSIEYQVMAEQDNIIKVSANENPTVHNPNDQLNIDYTLSAKE